MTSSIPSRRRAPTRPLPVLAAAAVAGLLASPAGAVTHEVNTWQSPMAAVQIAAEVGDDLAWPAIACCHTVTYLPHLDNQDLDINLDEPTICTTSAGGVRLDVGGSASVTLTEAGTFYYVCTIFFPLHCENGMRVRVDVTDPAVGVSGEIVDAGAWGRVKLGYR